MTLFEKTKESPTTTGRTTAASAYVTFRLGNFRFRRDDYFAHIDWPKGSHIIDIDRFLRAVVRDIGWNFFYGWIYFDDVFGTHNHYGKVTLFAGSYDRNYVEAGTDYRETFDGAEVRKVFDAMARDWINDNYDPLAAPLETGSPIGPKNPAKKLDFDRSFAPAKRMIGLANDVPPRSEQSGYPVNRAFQDLEFIAPEIRPEPGHEGKLHAVNLFEHIARSDVTWNPSICSVTKHSQFCVTSEEHMLPVIHGNDRNEWFIQLSDEIEWDIKDKETSAPRGKVLMRAGDVCAMPSDIRHQGFSPKRSMLLVIENANPELPKMIREGTAPKFPVDFDQ